MDYLVALIIILVLMAYIPGDKKIPKIRHATAINANVKAD